MSTYKFPFIKKKVRLNLFSEVLARERVFSEYKFDKELHNDSTKFYFNIILHL